MAAISYFLFGFPFNRHHAFRWAHQSNDRSGRIWCIENTWLLALPMNLVWSIQLPRCEDQRTAECHFFGSLLNMLRGRWILVSWSEHQFQKSTIFLTRYSSNLTEKGEGTDASHGYDFANSHKKTHVHSTGWLEIPKSQGCAERSRRREGLRMATSQLQDQTVAWKFLA